MESKGLLMATTVTYGLQYLRSLPTKFENVRVHYEITDSVREGETVDAAMARLTAKVDYLVQARIEEIDAEVAGAQ
jgi:hypothetical protein